MRVISLNGFTDDTVTPPEVHPYCQDFDVPEGKKLDRWLKEGRVRIDDRLTTPSTTRNLSEGL